MQCRVDVAPRVFVAVWWSIALLHTLCSGYHAVVGLVYLFIPIKAPSLLANLELLDLSVPGAEMPLVGGIYMTVSTGYAYALVSMMWSSVRSRRLVFSAQIEPARPGPIAAQYQSRLTSSMHMAAQYCSAMLPPKGQVAVRFTKRTALVVWRSFNVRSPNYGVVYVLREIVQTVLQTYQAYRLSALISRAWMSNMVVVLLVINCLVSPLIQYSVRWSVGHTRLLCIVANLALDVMTSIGLPLALALPYYSDYNPVEGNYDQIYWYTDTWIIEIINEWRILFVTGWVDGCARLFIAYNLGRSLLSISRLIHVRDGSNTTTNQPSITAVVPLPSSHEPPRQAKAIDLGSTGWRARIERWGHRMLAVWGVAVATVHVFAISTGVNNQCLVQVHPWFTSSPACSLMEITCINTNRTGGADDFDAALDTIEREWLAYLIIRHCPAVEITPRIQELSWLLGLKFYNATLVDWPQTAALTQTTNPEAKFVFFIKSNVTQVPPGLYHPDFPSKLTDIEFIYSNLTTLPTGVADVWPLDLFLALEHCAFTDVPDELTRLQPSFLTIVGNRISDIPAALLENPRLQMLMLSDNPIQSLPPSLAIPSSIWFMVFVCTQIQALPDWLRVDALVDVMAGDTPFCDSLSQGNASALGVTESELGAWQALVNCTPADELPFLTNYPNAEESAK